MKKAFFLVLLLFSISNAETKLKNIQYSIKKNGIMVSLDFTDPISDENIIGWKSDRGWLYLTLLGVKAPKNMIPNTGFNGVVKDIVLDDFDESIQIAILVGRPIVGYDIVNSQNEPTTVVFIHTQMRVSEVYTLKKHIEKEGSSLFGQVQTSKFPEYNTNFESAFKNARRELGPNSIFRYDGKLFTTSHPTEEKKGIKDALRDKTSDVYFDYDQSKLKSIDGEEYTDLKINENKEDISNIYKSRLGTKKAQEKSDSAIYDDIQDGRSIKTFFSDLFNPKKSDSQSKSRINNTENKNDISELEQKILALEEQLYSKEKRYKIEQKQWESRAEERQSLYRSQLQKLEKELIEIEGQSPNKKTQPNVEELALLENEKVERKKYRSEVNELEKQLRILEKDLKRRDNLLSQYESARNKDKEKIKNQYIEREILLKSELEELSKNLQERSALLDKEKKRLNNLADNTHNKANERRIEELVNQLGRLEGEIEEKDRALSSTKSSMNKEIEKVRNEYFEKEISLKSEIEELSNNLEERADLLDKRKRRIENLASKKQNKVNERRIEELVNQLGRLEDEIEEKDRALSSTKSSMNKEIEKVRNEYFEKEIVLKDDLQNLSTDLFSREKILNKQKKNISKEKEKNRNIYLSQKSDLDRIEFEQNRKFVEQEKILDQKKKQLRKLKSDRESAYRKRAQSLELELIELESEIEQKDRELFEEKQNWEMLSLKEKDDYKEKVRDLENDLFILEKSIKNKGKKIYAEKDKWRLLALERQKKIDEFEPMIDQFNFQLKSLREELLSDLYDKKSVLEDQDDYKQKDLFGFIGSFKKRQSKDINKKEEWIDSVYTELEDNDFSFQEYFSLALPNGSESLDEPPTANNDKDWRKGLPETKRDRYKSSAKDPVFEYYYNGGVRVETNMAGIPIYINGKHVGETPLNSPIQVEPGWHQISGFSPLYKQVAESDGLSLVSNDPIVKNNQLFGSKTVFVESGKVANVSLKFNRMGNTPKKWKEIKGGWIVGLPMILFLFTSITWGL